MCKLSGKQAWRFLAGHHYPHKGKSSCLDILHVHIVMKEQHTRTMFMGCSFCFEGHERYA
jgi:hypothetical protein